MSPVTPDLVAGDRLGLGRTGGYYQSRMSWANALTSETGEYSEGGGPVGDAGHEGRQADRDSLDGGCPAFDAGQAQPRPSPAPRT